MVARSSIPDPRPMPRLSWALLAGAASIGALSALYVALAPAGDQTPLVDRAWNEVVVIDPEVAGIVARLLVVLGLLGFGVYRSIGMTLVCRLQAYEDEPR